jgi:hypothetical protein
VTAGKLPITTKQAKDYLKLDSDSDDEFLQKLITSVVQFGERYTGRDFRANSWTLTIDCFEDRILLRRSQVATVSDITYLLSSVPTSIAPSVWYLKKTYGFSEVLLSDGQCWPTDGDKIEAGIVISFTTEPPRYLEEYCVGALRHIAFLYQNRGDCGVNEAAKKSGAIGLYAQGRIQRI